MYKKLMVLTPPVLLVIFTVLMFFDALRFIDNAVYDNLLQSEREPNENIIIIGIDERSIDEIGTWPWPRYFMADAINKLLDLNAAVIGVDVLYDMYGADEEHDRMLIEAASRSDKVVFGTMGIFEQGEHEELIAHDYITPFIELYDVTRTGFSNINPDPDDGVIRKGFASFRYGDMELTPFSAEIYSGYMRSRGLSGNLPDIPTDDFGQFYIDFVAGANSFAKLSLWGLINDEYPAEIFDGAIVLIGAYTAGVGTEVYFTSIDKSARTFGVEIHANKIQNLMENNFKREIPWYMNLIGLGVVCVSAIVLFSKLKPVWAALGAVSLIFAQLIIAKILYSGFDIIVASAYVILFVIFAYLLNLILSLLNTRYEKAHIHGLFGRFVAPEVVEDIVSGKISAELGGALRDVTLLFVDIRGFTAFSESNPPEKVVEMVNRYLDLTSSSIRQNGGTIDKYIGDATMAVFNAPNDLQNHALCAVRAAWDMKKGSVPLREEILNKFGVDLQFGIGINCGQAVVGNMGSTFRMDYTVIGDAVNTAARLESSAQKGQIIVSDAVYQRVKNNVEAVDLGFITVKNKQDGIHVHEIIGVKE